MTHREHFIPLRKSDLVKLLAKDVSLKPSERESFLALCRMLEATLHFEYQRDLEQIKDSYAEFDPDADTKKLHELTIHGVDHADEFFEHLVALLEKANFEQLDRANVEQAVNATGDWGVRLDVDFEAFDRLEVFSRGEVTHRRQRRRAINFFRKEEFDVDVFQRLVVAFRLKECDKRGADNNPDYIYLKIFKNIPKCDLEMLLPGTKVRMSLLDRCKILLPTISGIIMTIMKIVKGAVVLAFAGISGLLGFLGLVGATIGYGVKSFFGYLHTKDKYQLNLTKNLYYQNLDNNAGVLFRLLDEVEEQEFREAILAYFLLWKYAPANGWTEDELDARAESFLERTLEMDVDFEVDDAMAKLERLGLAKSLPGKRCIGEDIDTALANLDREWDSVFRYEAGHSAPRKAA